MYSTFTVILELAGTVAFAIAGALTAVRRRMDSFRPGLKETRFFIKIFLNSSLPQPIAESSLFFCR
ncbi:MAG: TRIC cation channel family protein [Synergistes sp.]|nr:TRIC cation channel family protein [Synergistes sp.]